MAVILDVIEYLLETMLGVALIFGVKLMTIVMFVVLSITAVSFTAKLIRFAWDWRNTDRREARDLIIRTPIMAFGAYAFGTLSLIFLAELLVWARA
jgi:hypothetical protein